MSTQPVDVLTVDQTGAPLPGVEVVVLSSNLRATYARGTTDADGRLAALLPGGFAVEVRFFHPQARVRPRTTLTVPDEPTELTFPLQLWSAPISVDARVCMVWGFTQNPNGVPRAGVTALFKTGEAPLVYSSTPYVTGNITLRSNENGYFEAPLLRCTKVRVILEGADDESLFFQVPDQDNANLFDLVFPYVSGFAFSEAPPLTLGVAEEKNLVLTPTWSDLTTRLGSPDETIEWSSSNEDVVEAYGGLQNVFVRGVAPGTATVTARRVRSSAQRVPQPPILGSPFLVTVA